MLICRNAEGVHDQRKAGKNEHRLPYLMAAARELLGMIAISSPSKRGFSHAGELYSEKRASLGVRICAILMLIRMNPDLGMN